MRALVVLAHPEPRSFNGHLAAVAREALEQSGSTVEISDLYGLSFDAAESVRHFPARADAERFDVQLEQRAAYQSGTLPADVRAELEKIMRADLVVLQFPLWWFGLPAILKGWMDRVFVYGGLYSSQRVHERGVCRGKKALLSVTTGSSRAACSPTGREGDTRLALWPAFYSLRYVGFTVLEPFITYGVRKAPSGPSGDDLRNYLGDCAAQYSEFLQRWREAPVMPFNTDEDFDEHEQLKPDAPVYGPFIRHLPQQP